MSDIYLSPSSRHFNKGYGGYGTEETRVNLITDVIQYDLERLGIKTQRNAPFMELFEIVAQSNSINPKLHIAIASQSLDSKTSGCQVYYYKNESNSQRFADDVVKNLGALTNACAYNSSTEFGGLGYYELVKTQAPAVIIFIGFHDCPKDAQFIIDNTYQIGVAIAKAVVEYLGKEYKEDPDTTKQKLMSDYNGVTY